MNTAQIKNLTDQEKELVLQFISNEKMADAVKKVLLDGIYEQGTSKVGVDRDSNRNWAWSVLTKGADLSNEQAGQCLRSVMEGISFLETSFNNMNKMKSIESPVEINKKGR